MHKSATKCNETIGKWCKNKHGASKIIDTLETYQGTRKTTIMGRRNIGYRNDNRDVSGNKQSRPKTLRDYNQSPEDMLNGHAICIIPILIEKECPIT
jgi:hypothetical protein